MIQGYTGNYERHPWPMLVAGVSIPGLARSGILHFLIDTGANETAISPKDATRLGIGASELTVTDSRTGLGGKMAVARVEAEVRLDHLVIPAPLWIVAPSGRQRPVVFGIPSVIGRDILSLFTLVLEDRSGMVVLLEEGERWPPGVDR